LLIITCVVWLNTKLATLHQGIECAYLIQTKIVIAIVSFVSVFISLSAKVTKAVCQAVGLFLYYSKPIASEFRYVSGIHISKVPNRDVMLDGIYAAEVNSGIVIQMVVLTLRLNLNTRQHELLTELGILRMLWGWIRSTCERNGIVMLGLNTHGILLTSGTLNRSTLTVSDRQEKNRPRY
jgi:hypothetical protein